MSRYSSALNQMVRGADLAPAASAARTATGNSGWLSAEEFSTAVLTLSVTAASGTTPTLDVTVETADDSSGTNNRAVTGSPFTQKTAAGSQRKTLTGFDAYYKVIWTIGGTTPSFTFSVTGIGK